MHIKLEYFLLNLNGNKLNWKLKILNDGEVNANKKLKYKKGLKYKWQ